MVTLLPCILEELRQKDGEYYSKVRNMQFRCTTAEQPYTNGNPCGSRAAVPTLKFIVAMDKWWCHPLTHSDEDKASIQVVDSIFGWAKHFI
jgi:hypothetical protein